MLLVIKNKKNLTKYRKSLSLFFLKILLFQIRKLRNSLTIYEISWSQYDPKGT